MKRSLYFIFVALFTVSMFAVSCTAQNNAKARNKEVKSIKKELKKNPIKEARKEAKRMKKEGWKVQPGSIVLDKLLEKSWIKQMEENEDGSLRYIWADGNAVARSQAAAEMQSMNLAQLQLASQIATSVASLINTNIANAQESTIDANTVTEVVQSAKNIVAQKIGRIDPVFKIFRNHESYKPLENGTIEMQVRIFYDKQQAEMKAKEVIKDELRKKTKATEEELKKLMGM